MKIDMDVCKESVEKAAMYTLLADVIVTAGEAVFVPGMLILEIVLLHLVIAAGALSVIVRCNAGPLAYRRTEYGNIVYEILTRKPMNQLSMPGTQE